MNPLQKIGLRLLGVNLEIEESKRTAPTAVAGGVLPIIGAGKSGKAIMSPWDTSKAIAKGLKVNGSVYACVTKIAGAASSVPFIVEKRNAKREWERLDGHELEQLLDAPNPHYTQQDLIEVSAHHMLLGGNSLWHINSARGKPAEIWPLLPDNIKPIPDALTYLAGYEYKIGSFKRKLEPGEVVHHMFLDPSNPYWGLGPLQAVFTALEVDQAATKFQASGFSKRLNVDGLISIKRNLTQGQYDDAVKAVEKFIADERRYLVLGDDTDFKPFTSGSARDMEVLAGRKFSREEICAAFGVPPVLLGSSESSTYNNVSTSIFMFWYFAVMPLLENLGQTMTLRLATAYGKRGELRVRADLTNVKALQEDLLAKAKTAESLARAGYSAESIATALRLDLTPAEVVSSTTKKSGSSVLETKAEADRAEHWKSDDATREKMARIVEPKLAALFHADGLRAAQAFVSGGETAALSVNAAPWATIIYAARESVTEHYGQVTGRDLEGQKAAWNFKLTATLKAFIREETARQVTNILETTRTRLKALIGDGLERNQTTDQIAKRIKEAHDEWGTSNRRAFLIARTEVGNAANYGSLEGAKQVGVDLNFESVKTWVSSRDSRVRSEHASIDGETVGLEAVFSNGLEHPSEPNCRCVLQYKRLR
jgi:HK97 family phage portal protein